MRRVLMRGLGVVLFAAGIAFTMVDTPALEKRTHVEYLAGPSGPSPRLSEAVRVGKMLYLSGKLGTLPGKRQLAAGGIEGETRQAMKNIKDALQRHGSGMDQVVRCTVFLVDIGEWPAMNEVYVTFFPRNVPARAAVAVAGLVLDARVEIECLAYLE